MNFFASRLKRLEYPFSKSWVFAAALMAIVSIIFAVLALSGEEDVVISVYTLSLAVHPLLLYFLFIFCLASIMLALKIYLYTLNEEKKGDLTVIDEEEREKIERAYWKWGLVTMVGLIIATFFIPMVLLNFLSPIWWFISLSGFAPGVALPEVILFLYCERKKKLS